MVRAAPPVTGPLPAQPVRPVVRATARPGRRLPQAMGWLVLGVAMAVLLCVPAAAYPESAAASLRGDVVSAGHKPDVVEPHAQWTGYLSLQPGTAVTAATYQICRVGSACFAPPHVAFRDGNTFRFTTTEYLVNGKPVDYQPGWRIGVQWQLTTNEGGRTAVETFPEGPAADDPICQDAGALECQEQHYLAFDIAGGSAAHSPVPSAAALLAVLAVAAVAARRPWRRDPA